MKKLSIIASSFFVLYNSGCTSSLKSEKIRQQDTYDIGNGIVYYMPKRDIRFDVKVASNNSNSSNTNTPTASTTSTTSISIINNSNHQQLSDDEIAKQTEQKNDAIAKQTEQKFDLLKQNLAKKINSAIDKLDENTKKNVSPLILMAEKDSGVDTSKQITVTLVNNYATETYPDVATPYLLRYSKNYLADNNIGISVNSLGLLSITHSELISRVNDIAANIATDAANIAMSGGIAGPATSNKTALGLVQLASGSIAPGYSALAENSVTFAVDSSDCKDGTYSVVIDPNPATPKPDNICKITFDTDLIGSAILDHKETTGKNENIIYYGFHKAVDALDIFHRNNTTSSESGIFYRQDLPYKITVSSGSQQFIFTALSPNQSGTYFAPISRTFFADNSNEILLSNGILTGIKQNTSSELLAATQIPSTILGSYTDAVSKVFNGLSGTLTNQSAYQTNQASALETANKLQLCKIAIATNSIAGKSLQDATTAYQNIQTACGH
jgi:hypothetical protein